MLLGLIFLLKRPTVCLSLLGHRWTNFVVPSLCEEERNVHCACMGLDWDSMCIGESCEQWSTMARRCGWCWPAARPPAACLRSRGSFVSKTTYSLLLWLPTENLGPSVSTVDCCSRHAASLSISHYLVSVFCITSYIGLHFHFVSLFVNVVPQLKSWSTPSAGWEDGESEHYLTLHYGCLNDWYTLHASVRIYVQQNSSVHRILPNSGWSSKFLAE